MSEMWNLWHGCHKKSEGCQHLLSVCDYWIMTGVESLLE